jgi:hypothetical protein
MEILYLFKSGCSRCNSQSIGSAYSGLNVIIKKNKTSYFKGAVKTGFIVGGGNITNYLLLIEDAIATCEIKDCVEKATVISQSDKFDKLKKLVIE